MKAGRIFTGLLIVALGVVLLLNTYGILTWSVWYQVGKFWPVLLIICGILIFFDKSLLPMGIIILILGIGFSSVVPIATDSKVTSGIDQHSWKVESNITHAELKCEFGAGNLKVKDSSLNTVEFELKYVGSAPSVKHQVKGAKAYYTIRPGNHFPFNLDGSGEWNLFLAPDIIWELGLDVGASSTELDLSQLKLKKLEVDAGASDLSLHLGAHGLETLVNIDAGASNIKIVVPKDVRLQIELDGGLSSSNLEAAGLVRSGDYYVTPDSVSSDSLVKVNLEAGVSNLELVRL